MLVKVMALVSLVFALGVTSALSQSVILPAGTELPVNSKSDIDSSVMKPGDEVNFILASDVKTASGVIAAGSELFGRVVEIKKNETGETHVVVMFDFLKSGEDFYSMNALVSGTDGTPADVKFSISEEYNGCTEISRKGEGVKIEAGTLFKIKVLEDIVSG